MSVYVHKHGWPYNNYGLNGEVIDLTTVWQQYEVDFTTNSLAVAFSASYRDGTSCAHEVLVSVPLKKGRVTRAHDNGALADSTMR